MKKLFFGLLIGFFFLVVFVEKSVQGQARSTEDFGYTHSQGEIPSGMEEIEVSGGYRIIVPKGAKTRKIGAQLMIEGDAEYMARRFEEMDQEILRLKESVNNLQDRIEQLEEMQGF